jgi:hypothetical protein
MCGLQLVIINDDDVLEKIRDLSVANAQISKKRHFIASMMTTLTSL